MNPNSYIIDIIKDPTRMYTEYYDEGEWYVMYPDDETPDIPWYLCKSTTKEDVEFLMDAIALHWYNLKCREP